MPESEDAITTIRLRQPGHIQVHIEDIARIETAVGDDRKKGAWIYLRDNSERRYCLETAKKVREMIEEARSKEEVLLDVLAIALLLKAADKSADGRVHFMDSGDGLIVAAGGFRTEPLHGRDRSKYEHAEQQFSRYALVLVESKGAYRLNERGYQMAEFLVDNRHSEDQPFTGFVKLPARPADTTSQIGVQINQWNSNAGDVNSAVSENGNVEQSVK